MASSYTSNNRIEKIGTGEQAGTWGSTTNTNFDIIDRAINGVGAITLSGTTHTLTTTDGALSDGHFKVLVFGGSPSGTNTITITPNNQDKLYFVKNNTNQSITIKQGSGTTVTIATTKTAIVYADGAGSGANVAQIETGSESFTEDLTITTADGALLTLQTDDTTITNGDVLGALQFRAPSEGDGSDGIAQLVTGSIVGEAKETFADDENSTDLVFKLSAGNSVNSGVATEKMRLTHDGDLSLVTDGKSIKFGADSEIELIHDHNVGLKLKHTATADNNPVSLTLQTGETAIETDDILGQVQFQAPDESDSGSGDADGQAVAASVVAIAENAFTATANPTTLQFKTGSSEAATTKMHITSAGIVSIPNDGSSSSNCLSIGAGGDLKFFHESDTNKIVSGPDNRPIAIKSNSGQDMATFAVGDAAKLYFNGAEKIATTNDGISITGNCSVSLTLSANEVTATSDERLKSDIQTIDNALDKVMNMRGVSFTKQAEKGVGVIAQEIEKVLPEVVTDGEYKSVAYGNIVGVLIEAIKEQQKQIDELKKDK